MSSAVGMKRVATSLAAILAGIAVLSCLLVAGLRMTLHANQQRTQAELEQLTPLSTELRAAQAAAAANRKMLSEFKNWSTASRLPMCSILRAVQEKIPAQMVLYHFSVGIEQTEEKEPPACALRLSGTARGKQTVVEAKRQLNDDARLRSFCGEIKLISSQRDFGEDWAFAFEGRRSAGGSGE